MVALENVAFGNPRYGRTPQDVLAIQEASQIHRNNLLDPQIMVIGIAYVFTSTSEYGGYYTADFASPN